MIDNPCLRPASMADLPMWMSGYYQATAPKGIVSASQAEWVESTTLRALYDAEWKKRGFAKSP